MPSKTVSVSLMLPLHNIAATRGDGLHPELLPLFTRSSKDGDTVYSEFRESQTKIAPELER